MKKQVLILIAVLLTTNYVKAQINANPDPNGPVWMTGDCNPLTVCSFDDIPVLHLSDTSQNTQLPLRVQNDTLKFFPPVYDQGSIYCCTFASEIGYIFTYEMNRKRDASAGSAWSLTNGLDTIDLRNLYHPLFGYNFINDGDYLDKTCQTDGFKLLQSIGCPMYNYYYTNLSNLPGSVKAKYWMSSFDGYANAIHQKVDSIYQIQFNPYVYSTFDTLKHWLYDHNEGEGNIGGLASIAILTGGDSIVTLQNGDAIFYRLGNDPSTGHVVTIVGYDDEICYDLNNNGHIEQDEHGAFRVANSWGTNWGSGGFIWLPYKLMRNLQDKRRMAFCCTVKEWEPTVYVKGTWVHPHQYAKRNKFNVVLGTRAHSYGGMIDSESHDYPIFSQQGGPNSLQGINNADSICIGFDYSCLFQDLDNVGKYFIKIYNYSHTSGNKIKNLTLVDYRWNEIFELPFESEEYAIDDETKIIGIKYELLPFSTGIGSSVSYNWDVIARRRTSVSGNNACLQFSNKATVDMYGTESYDSELFIDEGSMLYIGDSCKVIARSGNCRIIIKGSLTLGNGVTFEARDGATLEIIYENDANLAISNATFINCKLDLPSQNLSFDYCHFDGTPLEMNNTSDQSSTAIVTNCVFTPNGSNIGNAVYIMNFAHYKVSGCTIDTIGGGAFKNGIAVYNSGSNSGWKLVSGNEISGCLLAGIQMYASSGSITMNTVFGNGYGIKLLNNCNIASLSGNCGATSESGTQFIHDNTNNEVYMTGSSVPQRFRYNAIHHNGNTAFVYHDAYIAFGGEGELPARGSIDVKYNHWGSGFVPTMHLYTNLVGGAYEYYPEWVLGDCHDDWVDAAMLLNEADSLNDAGAYLGARFVYKQVVEDYPETVSAETALKSLLALETYLDGDYETLQEYYLSNESIASNETLSHLAFSLANKCDELMGNYEDAIAWYENVLTDPNTSFNDSIFAVIDLGELYQKMDAGGEKGINSGLKHYVPASALLHKEKVESLLPLIPKELRHNNDSGFNDTLPKVSDFEVALLQNDTVALIWNIPSEAQKATLSWCNISTNTTTFGNIGQMQCASDVFHHFDAQDMSSFLGWQINDVSMILSPFDTLQGPQKHYFARIWVGPENDMCLLFDKELESPVYSEIITIPVDSIISIGENQELRFGYHTEGELMSWAFDWQSTMAPSNKGIGIRLYHDDTNNECVPDDHLFPTDYYNLALSLTIVRSQQRENVTDATLTGYRVYREGTLIKEIPYSFVTYYTDTEFTRGFDVEYCVTAVYGDEESEPVCATVNITGVGAEYENDGITVLPNPTNGYAHIEGIEVAETMVYNTLGQLVKTFDDTNEINLKGLPQGMYLLQITDESGTIVTRKIVVK